MMHSTPTPRQTPFVPLPVPSELEPVSLVLGSMGKPSRSFLAAMCPWAERTSVLSPWWLSLRVKGSKEGLSGRRCLGHLG